MKRFLPLAAAAAILHSPLLVAEDPPAPTPTPPAPGSSLGTPTSVWNQDTLTGDWGGVRRTLADRGVIFTPTFVGEVFGNVAGGIKQGAVVDDQLALSVDVDAAKLTGWKEAGSFHTDFLYVSGPNLDARHVGDLAVLSNITAYNTPHVQELWYQQPFWDQQASLKVGWIAVDTEFFVSPSASLFINSDFGTLPLLSLNDPYNLPIYPIAAPGVRFRVQPVPDFYYQGGVFSGNPGGPAQNKNGLDFRIDGGAFVLNEVGYLLNQGPDDKGLTGIYRLGAFVHTGPFSTWDSQSGNALSGAPLDDQGPDFGLYAVADQQLYKEGSRIISAFLRGGYAPSTLNVVNPYLDAGLNFAGFIPGRDDDVAGIAFARSFLSGPYSDYNQAVNGTGSLGAESVIEATYRVHLASWWTVQPDFQYFFTPSAVDGSRDAAVLGLRTSVSF